MTALATAADMTVFFDETTIADLLSDTGDAVTDIATDATLSTLLEAASGRLEGACTVSNLYATTDLAALTGNSLALLKEITCKLAMVMLVRRRPEKFAGDFWKAVNEETEDYLDRLRKGERLFGLTANRDAGLPTIDGPSTLDFQNLNMITMRCQNTFPSVASRLPLGR